VPTVGDPDGRSSEQVDAAFAQIVARFDVPVSPADASWPTSEDVAPTPAPSAGPIFPPGGPILNAREPDEPSLLEGLDTFGADLPDDDEPFVRPSPQPLPRISLTAIVGLLTTILGVVMIVSGNLLPTSASGNLLAGVAVTVAGGAMLLSRLRPGGDDDEDLPNDGAQV
jgi:hypothetical protein